MPTELPPPYPEIHAKLMAGRVIPFLGAGAPLYSRNPEQTSSCTETSSRLVTPPGVRSS